MTRDELIELLAEEIRDGTAETRDMSRAIAFDLLTAIDKAGLAVTTVGLSIDELRAAEQAQVDLGIKLTGDQLMYLRERMLSAGRLDKESAVQHSINTAGLYARIDELDQKALEEDAHHIDKEPEDG